MHIAIPTTIPKRWAFPCDKIHIKHSLQKLGSHKLTLTKNQISLHVLSSSRDNFNLYDSNSSNIVDFYGTFEQNYCCQLLLIW